MNDAFFGGISMPRRPTKISTFWLCWGGGGYEEGKYRAANVESNAEVTKLRCCATSAWMLQLNVVPNQAALNASGEEWW